MSRRRLRKLQAEHTVRQIEMSGERGRFDALARRHEDGTAPRAVSSFNLFQTPPELAQRVVDMLPELPAGAEILEPSAGLGRLYLPLIERFPSAYVTLVEQSPDCAAELYRLTDGHAVTLRQADFLTLNLPPKFDAVVMNPPFKMGRDIKHINRARDLLKPGGRLVSICASGPRQRAKLKPDAIAWHDLEAGAFKSSGTNVNAAIVVFGGVPANRAAAAGSSRISECTPTLVPYDALDVLARWPRARPDTRAPRSLCLISCVDVFRPCASICAWKRG